MSRRVNEGPYGSGNTFLPTQPLLGTSPGGQSGERTSGPPGPHLRATSTQPSPQAGRAAGRACVCVWLVAGVPGHTGSHNRGRSPLHPAASRSGTTSPAEPTQTVRAEVNSPSPMMPKVSPRILAAPEATSRICSTLWTRVPSRSAWCSQVVLRYRLRMWHMVESAVSSTDAAGTLQTAMPGDTRQLGGHHGHPSASPVRAKDMPPGHHVGKPPTGRTEETGQLDTWALAGPPAPPPSRKNLEPAPQPHTPTGLTPVFWAPRANGGFVLEGWASLHPPAAPHVPVLPAQPGPLSSRVTLESELAQVSPWKPRSPLLSTWPSPTLVGPTGRQRCS